MKLTKDSAAVILCRMGGIISCSRKKPGTVLCPLYEKGKCNEVKVKAAKKQLIQAAEEILKKGNKPDATSRADNKGGSKGQRQNKQHKAR